MDFKTLFKFSCCVLELSEFKDSRRDELYRAILREMIHDYKFGIKTHDTRIKLSKIMSVSSRTTRHIMLNLACKFLTYIESLSIDSDFFISKINSNHGIHSSGLYPHLLPAYLEELYYKQEALPQAVSILGSNSEELAQIIEFLDWLRSSESAFDIEDNPSKEEVENTVVLFCIQRGYDNSQQFASNMYKWLRGEGQIDFLVRLSTIFSFYKVPKFKHMSDMTLKSYKSAELHGIFLFLSSGDFGGFVDSHWEDLNYLTGNYINIYYSKENLNNEVSGYRILAQFKSLDVDVDSLPALIIWRDNLQDAETIFLDKLPHEEILKAVQQVVKRVQNRQHLDEIARDVNVWIEERLNKLGILVRGKDTVMVKEGDTYHIGQAGAVGKHARSDNNTFYQSEPKQTLAEAAAQIQQLLNQLEQTNPAATDAEKIAYVNGETTPNFKRRVVGALQAGGEAAIEEFLDNPYINVGKAIVKGWLKP